MSKGTFHFNKSFFPASLNPVNWSLLNPLALTIIAQAGIWSLIPFNCIYLYVCVQKLSGQLLPTAWLPPASSMRQTWWCPSTTWTTSSTRTKTIWRWAETLAHAAASISLSRVYVCACVCVFVTVCVCICDCVCLFVCLAFMCQSCLYSAHHSLTTLTAVPPTRRCMLYWLAAPPGLTNITGVNSERFY